MANYVGGVLWPDDIDPFKMGWMAELRQDGGECITQQGLIFLTNEAFGQGKWSTRVEILTTEEAILLRAMMKIPDDDGMVILRGILDVPEAGLIFTQYGTCSKKTLKGFIKFDVYPIEMASTRAVNRAMRFAVGAPVSRDEVSGGKEDDQSDNSGQQQSRAPAKKATASTSTAKKSPVKKAASVVYYCSAKELESLTDRVNSIQTTGAITDEQAQKFYDEIDGGTMPKTRYMELNNSLTKVYNEVSGDGEDTGGGAGGSEFGER